MLIAVPLITTIRETVESGFQRMSHSTPSLFDKSIIAPAIGDSFRKLDLRLMIKNPVMFVTLVGAVLTTFAIFTSATERGFVIQLAIWLWFTVSSPSSAAVSIPWPSRGFLN